MKTLLQQLKKRRLDLGLKQNDMLLRIGVSRQQYQRLESKGNPRLETLELVAQGLNSELMLIPKEKLSAVLAILEANSIHDQEVESQKASSDNHGYSKPQLDSKKSLSDDPWQDLLGDDS